MPILPDKLNDAASSQLPYVEPRYSRKTNHVTITIRVGEIPIDFSISIKRLDRAVDRVCRISDGTGPLQNLLDELLHARQRYGHIIDGKKKSRGRQSGRNEILYELQYASAWTYSFIRHQWNRSTEDRNPFREFIVSLLAERYPQEPRELLRSIVERELNRPTTRLA